MDELDPEEMLSTEEFEALDEKDQEDYLALLHKSESAWTLTGKQVVADKLADEVKELLYGGAAGGGKSEWILHRAWRLSRSIPGHRSLILRTSFQELRRTLIARSIMLYGQHTPVSEMPRYRVADKEWHFPNGSIIEFGYCVAGDTLIAMGDGSFKRMDAIKPGDLVETLEGPRQVLKHFHVGPKPSVRMTLPTGESVVASESHAVLLASGQWRPPCVPCSCRSTQCRFAHRFFESMNETYPWHGQPLPGSYSDRQQEIRAGILAQKPGSIRPSGWSLEVGVHSAVAAARSDVPERALWGFGFQGYRGGYPTCIGSCDAQVHQTLGDVRSCIPSPVGAGTRGPTNTPEGGQESTQPRSPWGAASYCHPYMKAQRPLYVDVHQASAEIVPVGEQDLWDMQVDGANHYVSYGGMVHQNCETVEDAAQYQGAEYDMIAFDESTQFTAEQYDFIRTRARTTVSKKRKGARPHIIGATNPGDKGHEYFKGTFVDATDYGEMGAVLIIKDDEDRWNRASEEQLANVDPRRLRHVAFVPSTVADNPHVDPDYVANLMTMPEKLQRRMLYGDWDLPEGMYFEDFKRSIADEKGNLIPYHVIPAFPIPDSWYKVRALDWGFSAPYCCLWLAWDNDGRCYVYREAYESRLTTKEQAEQVVGLTRPDEKINASVADPSCWAKRDTLTIADQWKDYGLRVTKAKNDRLAGWMRVREYLKPMEDGWPALQVFENCQNLVRTMPNMLHDKIDPEDLDTKLEDHAVDALRYGLMLRPRHAKPKESPLDWAEKRFLAAIGKGKKKNKNFLV